MKKLSFFFLLVLLFNSCNTIKFVKENELLLAKNSVYVDSTKNTTENIAELLMQRPNAKALGVPLSLYFYNLGNPQGAKTPSQWGNKNPKIYRFFKKGFSEKQSISVANTFIGFNHWFLNSGEAPVIINPIKTQKTIGNLKAYFQTQGYFRAKITSKKDTIAPKKGEISYHITKGNPSFLDTIQTKIASPILDSLYKISKEKSFLSKGSQYKDGNFIKEANRLVELFRNNGIYHFNENYISFDNDTLKNYQKTNVEISISDRIIPFKIQKIKKISVFTDYSYNKKDSIHKDSAIYNGIHFYAHEKIKYNPKILSQSLFMKPNMVYSDESKNLTRTHLRSLKNFKSTSIRYNELTENDLEATVFLTPIEKYTVGFDTELSRSNIRNFDVSLTFSLINRNTFKGAETFKFSTFGSYFSSNNGLGWEMGADISLEIPRFIAPFGWQKMIPKRMFPKSKFLIGGGIQKNIGLDNQNITVALDYKWKYNTRKSLQLELFNTQYIRNLNINNYFTIYGSEYSKLKKVADEIPKYKLPDNQTNNAGSIVTFMKNVAQDENFQTANAVAFQNNLNIFNRYNIITSDFLIPEIAFSYTYNNQENSKDASFSFVKFRVANAGNLMGILSEKENTKNQKTFFKIPIAQYFKLDLEYKKYWNLGNNTVLAHRTFLGSIINYNQSSIPFSRSYFAGGSNDVRAWKTYDLGAGTRKPGLEYNIGSLKFLSSFEYRFNMLGALKGALFTDAGNIWDITNSDFIDDAAKFDNIKSFTDIAVGAGFGLRYDFNFLIARLDVGFKVHEPYLNNNRWFRNFNISRSVLNIGINYPF
ncbi:BamA/TamA family outer membrane protein [Tenacibaculum piscium]|uniref:Bacterial surface antigen (D15) domain-containing protein n=3 Tax=Tenacibaculum piscium TaxID=1458515 RepID=A0A2H1YIR8_9FLAO|nr:BamA/TamA family outer membrane protein [Tenacibaculum piscium]MBE7628616.1 BamA/TamA family outer membrane protein [Tenacibaculum piscium]MBE7669757.1 BamA/TamA family outer membrane protein [Tenacibaculum piscium]MBE7684655.1 BamA/TamA family outer membrane protein [Tenacibaculum piscium]MBE7689275.1 BamA/TamA family outer membrane protein [Tenacibaculum piscium]MCG8182846.1 BamA/TamA family outer membrane protein [Tenacibaculum piscium]